MRAAVAGGTLATAALTLVYVAYFTSEENTTAIRLGTAALSLGKARAGLVLQPTSGGSRGWNALRGPDSANGHSAAHGALRNGTASLHGSATPPARSRPSAPSREGCEALPVGDMVDVNGSAALLPSLAISRTRLLFAPQKPRPLKCALFVYFHFAKAGGTSMREAMARQAVNGTQIMAVNTKLGQLPAPGRPRAWGPPVGKDVGWEIGVMANKRLREWLGSADERKKSPRLFIECHSGCVFVSALAAVQAARLRLEREGCTVLTLTHLREPVSQVLSAWYYWAIKWDASKIASPAGWVRSWVKPDHYYNEYLYGRASGLDRIYSGAPLSRVFPNASARKNGSAARPSARAEVAGAVSEQERCGLWLEQTDHFLDGVDIVGTVGNWERTWLRAADLLRFPRLEPRQHKGLASCLSKRERSALPQFKDRCQKARLCRESAVQPADVAALTAKMGCSRRTYTKWEWRSEEALQKYEAKLFTQPPVTLVQPTNRFLPRLGVARRGGTAAPLAARPSPREDGTPARSVTVRPLELFRERACHLRSNYFCNWNPSEEKVKPLREAMRMEEAREKARREASEANAKARAKRAAARAGGAAHDNGQALGQRGGGQGSEERPAAGGVARQPRNRTMDANALELYQAAQAYERQSAGHAQQHQQHGRGRQGKGGGSKRPRGARSVSAQSQRDRRAAARTAAGAPAGRGGRAN